MIVLGHWAEHLLQAFQIYVLGWPVPQALGALGYFYPYLVRSEMLHYGYALVMLVAVALAHTIPPMPLYSEQFKTVNHEGDIFLRTSAPVMITSFIILAGVGIFSGLWPALKAAAMDPVEALRYE